jgi:hypothetical protein
MEHDDQIDLRRPSTVADKNDVQPAYGKGGKYNFPNARMQLIEQDDEKRAFVAKAIENNLVFFNAGIQQRVSSDEELCERLNWFFTQCAETQQIPNVEKMANALGYHRNTLLDWENGNTGGFSPYTKDIIKQAKQILASIDAELAQEGKTQPVVYMFRAKNFYGMRDQQDVVLTPNMGGIDSADAKAIEAKYAELPEV